jgi:hypothetical protein
MRAQSSATQLVVIAAASDAPQVKKPLMKEKSILLWKVKTVNEAKTMQVRPHASNTVSETFHSVTGNGWPKSEMVYRTCVRVALSSVNSAHKRDRVRLEHGEQGCKGR